VVGAAGRAAAAEACSRRSLWWPQSVGRIWPVSAAAAAARGARHPRQFAPSGPARAAARQQHSPCSRWISLACASSWSLRPFFSMSAGEQVVEVGAWRLAPPKQPAAGGGGGWEPRRRPPAAVPRAAAAVVPTHLTRRRWPAAGCHGRRCRARWAARLAGGGECSSWRLAVANRGCG
jgi:hypothetical protein